MKMYLFWIEQVCEHALLWLTKLLLLIVSVVHFISSLNFVCTPVLIIVVVWMCFIYMFLFVNMSHCFCVCGCWIDFVSCVRVWVVYTLSANCLWVCVYVCVCKYICIYLFYFRSLSFRNFGNKHFYSYTFWWILL